MSRLNKGAALGLLVAAWMPGLPVQAEQPTREAVEAWLAESPPSLPAPGTTVAPADIASLRALLPPGYFELAASSGLSFEIDATGDYSPPQVYQDATAANAGKATLRAEGGVDNYTAGRPFDPARFNDVSPSEAGMMIAWNNVYRWQYYGYRLKTLDMIYVQPTADGKSAGNLPAGLEGGGKLERSLVQTYHRVYLNHLAMLPNQGFKVSATDSSERFYKDVISFVEPFDVAGTTFVVERALDANEEDQVNSYLPSQRRVRRLSAKERADNFMGSNFTLDDFEAFSGRVMDYEWIYRGQKSVLHVSNSREKTLRFGGPLSNIAIDRREVRPCFVVELKPRWEGHPMSAKFLLIDQQTDTPAMALTLDRENRLKRIFITHYQRPVVDTSTPERALETSVSGWRGSVAYDLSDNTSTIARGSVPTEFPTMTERDIKRTFSLSRLTEGR